MRPTLLAVSEACRGLYVASDTLKNIQESMKPLMQTFYETEQIRKNISAMMQSYSVNVSPVLRESIGAIQNMTAVSRAISESIPRYDFSGLIKVSEILSGIDVNKLSIAAQRAMETKEWTNDDSSIEEFIETVSNTYVAETEEEKNKIEEIKAVTNSGNKELTNEEKALRLSYIQTIFTILGFFVTLFFGIASLNNKVEIPDTTVNNVQYVSNYYIKNGYDKDFLNSCGLRIVNQTIKPRIKPDCSSRVTGTLEPGIVVSVTDKYKKWILITWTNEDGDYISGWIQNYKVSEFTK